MNEEVGKLTRAAGVVGFFTLLSRVSGLFRDVVIGFLFGAQGAADAYFVAFRIPNLLRRLTAEGALTVAFIPVFTNYLAKEGKAEAIKVTQIVFTFLAIFLGLITLLGIVFARPLTHFFAPGFVQEPEKFQMTILQRLKRTGDIAGAMKWRSALSTPMANATKLTKKMYGNIQRVSNTVI